jgi:hypothetical protein
MRYGAVAVFTLATFTISACSTYAPISLQLAPQASTVRLSLSGDSRAQSFGILGSQIETIEGRVRSLSDSVITLSASEVSREGADDERLRGETVVIPWRYVVSVSQKRVQVGRSLLLAAAIAGGVIWIGSSLGSGSVAYSKPPTQQPGQ